MLLILAAGIIGAWLLFTGWKFYQTINWEERPEPSPDLQAMRKREVELLHIQDVLTEAYDGGKLSQKVVEEFNHYCDSEIQAMKVIETAWKNRKKR